jgi:hypothetical protein
MERFALCTRSDDEHITGISQTTNTREAQERSPRNEHNYAKYNIAADGSARDYSIP